MREALARPLTKPAVRKLAVFAADRYDPVAQWFVLQPMNWTAGVNGAATPCTSFEDALAELRRISR